MKEAQSKSNSKTGTDIKGSKHALDGLTSGIDWSGDPTKDGLLFYQMKEKLKFYEKIEIDNLLEELKNKTYLIESFIQQKKDENAQKSDLDKPSKVSQRPSPVRKTPDLRWNIKYAKKADTKTSAVSAEPSSKMEYELSRLTVLNQQLIQILENNSINVPNDIVLQDKHRVSFALSNARPESGSYSTITLPYVIPDISRASSARKNRSRPQSGLSATIIGTPSIAGSRPSTARLLSRPSTARLISRPSTARLLSRPISGRQI